MADEKLRQLAADGVEIRRGHVARARQRDAHLGLDAARPRRHHHHAVGQENRLLDRMRDEQHGQLRALPQVQQLVLQALARHRVERAERLVHQHHLRVVGQHAGDGDALLHAAGKLVRIGVGEVLQARPVR